MSALLHAAAFVAWSAFCLVLIERALRKQAVRQGERNQGHIRDSTYWRNAYEELARQTGRDLNDGLGLDPRKAKP